MPGWHTLEGSELAHEVTNIAEGLYTEQSARRARYLHNQELFEGCRLGGNYDASGYYTSTMDRLEDDPLGLLRSAVQSGVSEVYGKQKPKPQFQTSGADWTLRRKAQKLDKICEGILHQRQGRWIDVWAAAMDWGVETGVQGTAAIHVLADDDNERICHELVPVCELYCDPAEGREPKSLFRLSPIDSEEAIALWCHVEGDAEGNERRKRAIEGAESFERNIANKPRAVKQVRMIQAWRLPLSKKLHGKAAVVIGGEIMAEEDWTTPAFPFAFLHWEPHRDGMWGSGIVDQGARLAEDAGELDRRLLARAIVASGKRIFYWGDSVNEDLLEKNDPEVAVSVDRSAPGLPQESLTPPFAMAEFEYLVARIRMFWDALGLSQTSAAARKEPGIESAPAQRTLNDTKAGRQMPKAQAFERLFVDLAHQHVWRLRELAETRPGFKVRWPGKTVFQEVSWAEADIANDTFAVTVAPASALSQDPAGRQQQIGELFAQRLITAQTYKQLLGWPDLEQELRDEQAEYEYVDALIERYLDAKEGKWDAGDYESPDGMLLDKERALMRFSAAYFRSRREKAPAFNVGLLKRYILELDKEIADAAARAAALQKGNVPPPAPPNGAESPAAAGPAPMAA